MEQLNIDVASEFILVAATLMRIKAKMLLPRKELDEEGNEIDPREELVQRLLEYKQYKDVTETLRSLETDREQYVKRGYAEQELQHIVEQYATETELHSLDIYKLLKAFQRVMEQLEERKSQPKHTVVQYPYTISGQKEHVLSIAQHTEKASFEAIFSSVENRMHAIFTFLALLELVQEKIISIYIGTEPNHFWIYQHESIESGTSNISEN